MKRRHFRRDMHRGFVGPAAPAAGHRADPVLVAAQRGIPALLELHTPQTIEEFYASLPDVPLEQISDPDKIIAKDIISKNKEVVEQMGGLEKRISDLEKLIADFLAPEKEAKEGKESKELKESKESHEQKQKFIEKIKSISRELEFFKGINIDRLKMRVENLNKAEIMIKKGKTQDFKDLTPRALKSYEEFSEQYPKDLSELEIFQKRFDLQNGRFIRLKRSEAINSAAPLLAQFKAGKYKGKAKGEGKEKGNEVEKVVSFQEPGDKPKAKS